MNKFKNIIQVTPWLILETTIEHFDKWADKSQKPKQGAKQANIIYQFIRYHLMNYTFH